MANIHILTTNRTFVQAVAHIAVPNVNNAAGIGYRAALIASGIGGRTVLADGDGTAGTISAAEKASIVSGAVFEHAMQIRLSELPSQAAARNAFLDTLHTRLTAEVQTDLQERLRYFGATRG